MNIHWILALMCALCVFEARTHPREGEFVAAWVTLAIAFVALGFIERN